MSKADWSKAPEGAEFYADSSFYKISSGLFYWSESESEWIESVSSYLGLMGLRDYEPRPKEWPETDERINNIGRNRTEDDMGHYDELREAESTQSAQQADRPLRKYERAVKGVVIDVYDVLVAYNVTCPATAHAIKKLLMPGGRHAKTWVEDIDEAILSLQRAKELRQ